MELFKKSLLITKIVLAEIIKQNAFLIFSIVTLLSKVTIHITNLVKKFFTFCIYVFNN